MSKCSISCSCDELVKNPLFLLGGFNSTQILDVFHVNLWDLVHSGLVEVPTNFHEIWE